MSKRYDNGERHRAGLLEDPGLRDALSKLGKVKLTPAFSKRKGGAHRSPRRLLSQLPSDFAEQDAEARRLEMTWAEWARIVLRAACCGEKQASKTAGRR